MLIINRIQLSDSNRRVDFKYELSNDIKKYFTKKSFFVKYDMDISGVPEEILIIPLLANIMPIAWFANFDVKVEKVDAHFLESLKSLKQEFSKYYNLKNLESNNLIFKEKIMGKTSDLKNEAMLFSGGVDAYTTYLRHHSKNLHLITIKGADIKLDDEKHWKDLVEYLHNTTVIMNNPKHIIESNIREFITFEVDKLLPNLGWWGKIQHGMALTCLTAPVCYLHQIKTLYIASTRSIKMEFSPWGSMPETDNLIKWNSTEVIHDGYELTRLDKVKVILNESIKNKIQPQLRVCYNEYKTALNCNSCEKCLRTIFSILIQGENPSDYGFVVNSNLYNLIKEKLKGGFSTVGAKMYWEEMLTNYTKENLFVISNEITEKKEIDQLYELVSALKKKEIGKVSNKEKLKHSIISSFPRMFNVYLKIRRKFI